MLSQNSYHFLQKQGQPPIMSVEDTWGAVTNHLCSGGISRDLVENLNSYLCLSNREPVLLSVDVLPQPASSETVSPIPSRSKVIGILWKQKIQKVIVPSLNKEIYLSSQELELFETIREASIEMQHVTIVWQGFLRHSSCVSRNESEPTWNKL